MHVVHCTHIILIIIRERLFVYLFLCLSSVFIFNNQFCTSMCDILYVWVCNLLIIVFQCVICVLIFCDLFLCLYLQEKRRKTAFLYKQPESAAGGAIYLSNFLAGATCIFYRRKFGYLLLSSC